MDALNPLTIARVPVDTPDVAALLSAHFVLMRAQSPEESCHVMAPDALAEADMIMLTAREGTVLLGVGGLKRLTADHGELKSMHTAEGARGRGVGAALLRALLDAARDIGVRKVSLETGSDPRFAAARSLYEAHGFEICPPFGDYVPDPFSVFMTRTI